MKLKVMAKSMLSTLDRFSPYPLLYPFLMSEKEKTTFDEAINKSRHLLEFGMGGSTIRALQKSTAIIYTVESSPEWIAYMRKYLFLRFFQDRRLHVYPVNIGPVGKWGYPVSEDHRALFERYSSSIYQLVDSSLLDLILVDGRFRVACTLKAILSCHENSCVRILIHDFWNRPKYHVVLNYLDVVIRVDTIGLFSIKDNVDLNSVKNDYEAYKFTPD